MDERAYMESVVFSRDPLRWCLRNYSKLVGVSVSTGQYGDAYLSIDAAEPAFCVGTATVREENATLASSRRRTIRVAGQQPRNDRRLAVCRQPVARLERTAWYSVF